MIPEAPVAHSVPHPSSSNSLSRWVEDMAVAALLLFVACSRTSAPEPLDSKEHPMSHAAKQTRIVFLHHSTGLAIWKGGVPRFIESWNQTHGMNYEIKELAYPAAAGSHARLRRLLPARVFNRLVSNHYPWDNQPYDYWNLWVAHRDGHRDRSELNLDDLTRSYDVIVFKHCFPVSNVKAENGPPSVSSPSHTLGNYKLQYEALKARMHQFPQVRFIVWTGPALIQASTNTEEAERARQFSTWVKETWDDKGDNIFIWDFRELQTDGGLFLKPEFAHSPRDSHPSEALAAKVAPLLGRRIVDVIKGRGDSSSLTGQ